MLIIILSLEIVEFSEDIDMMNQVFGLVSSKTKVLTVVTQKFVNGSWTPKVAMEETQIVLEIFKLA